MRAPENAQSSDGKTTGRELVVNDLTAARVCCISYGRADARLRNIEKTRSDSHDHQQEPEGQLRKSQWSGSLLRDPWERAAAGGASRPFWTIEAMGELVRELALSRRVI